MSTEKQPRDPQGNEWSLLLNIVLLSQLMQEMLDGVKETKHYKHELKFHCKKLEVELQKIICGPLDKLCGHDDTMMINILQGQESLVKQLATFQPEDFVYMASMINRYLQAPEAWKRSYPIQTSKVITSLTELAGQKQTL